VDLMWFLRDKLGFIQRLYDSASKPFISKMRRIDDHEPPFDAYDCLDKESDEPPFLTEWIEASEANDILGNVCVCLVQTAMKQFFEAFFQETGRKPPTGRGSWFERYRAFFLNEYGIDWSKGPVKLEVLEDLSLARNDIQHGGTLMTKTTIQNPDYARRFPNSLFTEMFVIRPKIAVNRDSLMAAIQAVEEFCSYLERERLGA
jgi:hypothetical protein